MIATIPFYKKLNKYEISCVLFERCNLKCKFCFEQTKSTVINIDYIRSLPHLIINNFNRVIKQDQLSIDKINIMFWGGEVFMDGLSDEMFIIYQQLMDDIEHIVHTHTIQPWISPLVGYLTACSQKVNV